MIYGRNNRVRSRREERKGLWYRPLSEDGLVARGAKRVKAAPDVVIEDTFAALLCRLNL